MIDWRSTLAVLSAVLADERIICGLGLADAGDVRSFQNVDYPPALNALILSDRTHVRDRVEAYVRLLEKVIALYFEDPELRAFYGFGPRAELLVDAERGRCHSVRVCRLDGYLRAGSEELCVLENNADAPAGTLFTPRLNAWSRSLLGRHFDDLGLGDPFAATRDVFLDELLAAYRFNGGTAEPRFVAILQLTGHANAESHELAKAFQARDVPAEVLDPRDLALDARGLSHRGRHVDLVWNKINTVHWRSVVEPSIDLVDRFARAIEREGTCFVNSFACRYIAESKTTLALFHDERLRDRFTTAEAELARSLVPPTFRLELESARETRDPGHRLRDALLDRPYEWVLKQAFDIRGDGVFIGRSTPTAEWQRLVGAATDERLLAQRYVEPCRVPIVLADSRPAVRAQTSSVDCFVFRGVLAGFGSKTSTGDKVNLFRGGAKVPVFVSRVPD